ncbi:MAG TPA: GAF domain-containing protein [Anaerolineae bacterium]
MSAAQPDAPVPDEPEGALYDLESQDQPAQLATIARWMSILAGVMAGGYIVVLATTGDVRVWPVLLVCAGFSATAAGVQRYARHLVQAVYLISIAIAVGMVGVAASVKGFDGLLIVGTLILPALFTSLFLAPRHVMRLALVSIGAAVAADIVAGLAPWPRFDASRVPVIIWLAHACVGSILIYLLVSVFNKLDRARNAAHQLARQLRLMYDTSRLFSGATRLDELLQMVAGNLARILNADQCIIVLRDPETGEPRPTATNGPYHDVCRNLKLDPDEPAVSRVIMAQRAPVVLDDVWASPHVSPRLAALFSTRSLLGLPLIYKDEVLGAVLIGESRHQRHFTQENIDRVWGLVQQVAVEIASVQSRERERQQMTDLAILNRVGAAVAASLDPAEVCRLIVQEISLAGGYDCVSVHLLKDGQLSIQATSDPQALRELPIENGIMGRAARTGQPILVSDVHADPDYLEAIPGVLSEACVPIRLRDETLGVINLEVRAPRVLGTRDLNLLVATAAQLAIALHNARLFVETQQHNLELEALHEIEQAIAALDLDRCLRTVAGSARSLVNARFCHVFLTEPGGWRLRAASGPLEDRVGEWFLAEGRGLVGWSAEHRQTVNVPNVLSDPRYYGSIGDTRSEVAVPLVVDDKVIGVLDVQSDRLAAFGRHEQDLLGMLAVEAAIAIHNARLFGSEKHNRQVTETLLEVTRALDGTLDLDRLLDLILDQLQRLVPYVSGRIALLDEQSNHYLLRAWHALPDAELRKPLVLDVDTMPSIRAVWSSRRPYRIIDTHAWPEWTGSPDGDDVRSWLGLPLVRNEQVIGLLMLTHTQPGFFTDEHERLAEAFSMHAAIAVENARLLDQARQQAERERLVGSISSKISASIQVEMVLQTAAEGLGRALGVSRCVIRLGADPDHLPVAYEFCRPGVPPLGKGQTQYLPMVSTALANRCTAIDLEPCELNGVPVLSGMVTPIFIRNRLAGILAVHQCDRPRRWTSDEVALLEDISAQLSIGIDNAELYQDATRSLSDLNLLHSIAMAVASAGSLPEAVNRVVHSVHKAMGQPYVSLMLVDPGTSELVVSALVGFPAHLLNTRLAPGQGITGWVAQHAQPVLVPDVRTDPRYVDPTGQHIRRSELAVPLIAGSQVVGVLNLESDRVDAFTEADMHLLATLSSNLTMIINNLRLLDEVRAANVRLQELDRLKSQFIANVSHELRTPLNAIIGFSEVLLDELSGALNDDQHEFVSNIHSSGRHLLALINDVLDLSKIYAGKLKLDLHPLPPHQAVQAAKSVVDYLFTRKGQRFVLDLEPDLPEVSADEFRLKQILINLLSNAYKFSPDGGSITLIIRRCDEGVQFTVIDQGNGIRPENHDLIFQEFVQLEGGLTRSTEGTGLGLPITRRLVEMHGGRIWIESDGMPGRGAAFHFTIPIVPVEPPARPVLVKDDRPAVLIVEDDPQFGHLLALYLSQEGYRPIQCETGRTLMALAHEAHPILITLDLLMPERDGWTLLHDLKSDPETQDIPVIIISALDPSGQDMESGAVEYLTKPLDLAALRDTLHRIYPAPKRAMQHVLVVDDDPLVGELVALMLPPPEYAVTTVTSGSDALIAVHRATPDVILLDLLMPGVNGYQFLDLLRAAPATHQVPVIVITAKHLDDAELRRLGEATQAVIRKGELTRQYLIEVLHRLRLPARSEPMALEAAL